MLDIDCNNKFEFKPIRCAQTTVPEALKEIERLEALARKLKVENELLKKQCETCGDNDGYISCLREAQRENTLLREEINTMNQKMADITKENFILKKELGVNAEVSI